jgi:large subunit ribosomal protein L17
MKQLGMKKAHREHTIRNLATSLLLYETLDTTAAKAKETKCFVETLLAKAKIDDLHTRRKVYSVLFDKNASDKIFVELIKRYEGRASGFVRSYKLVNRIGDNAPMIRLELVDKKKFVKESKVAKTTEAKAELNTAPKTEKKAK